VVASSLTEEVASGAKDSAVMEEVATAALAVMGSEGVVDSAVMGDVGNAAMAVVASEGTEEITKGSEGTEKVALGAVDLAVMGDVGTAATVMAPWVGTVELVRAVLRAALVEIEMVVALVSALAAENG
jgi:hypothetical protein